jgi:hypothetical protein
MSSVISAIGTFGVSEPFKEVESIRAAARWKRRAHDRIDEGLRRTGVPEN